MELYCVVPLLDCKQSVHPVNHGIDMLESGHPQNNIIVIIQSCEVKAEVSRVGSNLQAERLGLGSAGFLGSSICESNSQWCPTRGW